MPRCWADRAIMFSVIALVAWAIIGLPMYDSLSRARNEPARNETTQQTANGPKNEDKWLTKDAAGFFTFLLVVVGGFQLGFFAWQLWLIRESLDDAKTAADAAKEAADTAKIQATTAEATLVVMQNTAQQQLRAYVSMTPNLFGGLFGENIRITFDVKNHGETPAFEIRHDFSIEIFDNPLPTGFQFPQTDRAIANNTTLFPDATFESRFFRHIPTLPWQLGEIAANKQRIHCWGVMSYRDAFNVWRETFFSASAGGDDFVSGQIAYLDGVAAPTWGWDYGLNHNQGT